MGCGSYGEKNRGSLPPSRSRAVTETSNRFLMPVRLSVRAGSKQHKIESSPCPTRTIIAEESEPAKLTNPDERK